MNLDNEFWRYSLRTYALPGVAEQALQWQDEDGLNINLLLWCSWLESQDIEVGREHLRQAAAGLHDWDLELIQPLRGVRRGIKGRDAGVFSQDESLISMKAQLSETELLAEQWAQAWLYGVATDFLAEPESLHRSEVGIGGNVLLYFTEVFDTLEAAEHLAQRKHWLSLTKATKSC